MSYDIYLFEISFKDEISANRILHELSNVLGVSSDSIVEEDSYWDKIQGSDGKLIGISILRGTSGFKTFVKLTANFDLPDNEFSGMARHMSNVFGTETLIGDYRSTSGYATGLFLVYFPDGRVAEAVETTGSDVDINGFIEDHT